MLTRPPPVSFRDSLWLAAHGGVSPDNALEYFALSPFYDSRCNNARCVALGLSPTLGLPTMRGFEYAVYRAPDSSPIQVIPAAGASSRPTTTSATTTTTQPPPQSSISIVQQYRHSPTSVSPVALFYIVQGTLYQSPLLSSIIQLRLQASLSAFRATIPLLLYPEIPPSSASPSSSDSAPATSPVEEAPIPPHSTSLKRAAIPSSPIDDSDRIPSTGPPAKKRSHTSIT